MLQCGKLPAELENHYPGSALKGKRPVMYAGQCVHASIDTIGLLNHNIHWMNLYGQVFDGEGNMATIR